MKDVLIEIECFLKQMNQKAEEGLPILEEVNSFFEGLLQGRDFYPVNYWAQQTVHNEEWTNFHPELLYAILWALFDDRGNLEEWHFFSNYLLEYLVFCKFNEDRLVQLLERKRPNSLEEIKGPVKKKALMFGTAYLFKRGNLFCVWGKYPPYDYEFYFETITKEEQESDLSYFNVSIEGNILEEKNRKLMAKKKPEEMN